MGWRELYAYDGWDVVLDFVDPDGDNNGGSNDPPALARRYLHGAAVDQLLAEEDLSKSISAADRVLWQATEHGPRAWPERRAVASPARLVDAAHFAP